MNFLRGQGRFYLEDQTGKTIAEVDFPAYKEGVVDGVVEITHTFVDDSLRGQGMAAKLMIAVVEMLEAEHKQAKLTCSYAVKWFAKHPEYARFVAK